MRRKGDSIRAHPHTAHTRAQRTPARVMASEMFACACDMAPSHHRKHARASSSADASQWPDATH